MDKVASKNKKQFDSINNEVKINLVKSTKEHEEIIVTH